TRLAPVRMLARDALDGRLHKIRIERAVLATQLRQLHTTEPHIAGGLKVLTGGPLDVGAVAAVDLGAQRVALGLGVAETTAGAGGLAPHGRDVIAAGLRRLGRRALGGWRRRRFGRLRRGGCCRCVGRLAHDASSGRWTRSPSWPSSVTNGSTCSAGKATA